MAKKTPHYIESPRHAAMLELRSSNAARPHADARNKRERSRRDAKRAAVRRSYEDS